MQDVMRVPDLVVETVYTDDKEFGDGKTYTVFAELITVPARETASSIGFGGSISFILAQTFNEEESAEGFRAFLKNHKSFTLLQNGRVRGQQGKITLFSEEGPYWTLRPAIPCRDRATDQ